MTLSPSATLTVYQSVSVVAGRNLSLQNTKTITSILCHHHSRGVVTLSRPPRKTVPQIVKILSNSFSTELPEIKKSPHSKLLRVCSSRNTNLHFAAVEADMLRLDWDATMGALVDDWIKSNKWSSFTELERNIRAYVDKNLPFLVLKWRKDAAYDRDHAMKSINIADRIRLSHFPYEKVISAAAKHAISGRVDFDPENNSGKKSDKTFEPSARQAVLLEACKMLDPMTNFKVDRQNSSQCEWTLHHSSCSNCFRLLVSGWFLMWRRMREADQPMLPKGDVSAEEEMYNYVKKWISFCTRGEDVEKQNGTSIALIGGITHSDRPLLMGIATVLSLSKNNAQHSHSAELFKAIGDIFPYSTPSQEV
eukprot:CCRYP_020998-RB/>CCRYP_020998-RB protein AED:0.04 eAED:0.04 QI:90/1/1/1/0/0/3/877/363